MRETKSSPADTKKVVNTLNMLGHLEFDAMEACDTILDRLEDPGRRSTVEGFKKEHEAHARSLAEEVARLGGTPTSGTAFKRVVKSGRIVIARPGGDKSFLAAMRANEHEAIQRYRRALEIQGLDGHTRGVLEGIMSSEQHQRSWIIDQVEGLRSG